MVRILALASVLAMFVGLASASGGQLVIVESTVAKLPPGSIVDAAKPLTLAVGERLALVGEDGKVVRLQGPSSGLPFPADSSASGERGVVQALSRLFASDQPAPAWAAWGGFRGEASQGGEAANPTEVWAWNLYRSDIICAPTGIEPSLWRPDAGRDQRVVLLHLSTGREAEVEFAAGQQSVLWPKAVPLLDGGEYAVRDAGNLWERRLTLRVIPAGESRDIRQIAWMSDAGCLRQARLLVTRLQ
jgi:hypothetical protein